MAIEMEVVLSNDTLLCVKRLDFVCLASGVLGGICGYTLYTNLRDFFDSVYSPQ